MASPSLAHPRRGIRSTSHGTIAYSPDRAQLARDTAATITAIHPAHRTPQYQEPGPSNQPSTFVLPDARAGWRLITQDSNTPPVPPRSPLRPPFREIFPSLQQSYFPPPTLTSTSEPIAPDPVTSPISAAMHRDILSIAMGGPLDSNNITPDSVGSPLMMAPYVRGAGNATVDTAGGPSPAAFLESRRLPTGDSITSSSTDSPLTMAPYVRGNGNNTHGYSVARGPSPAALAARLEVARQNRPESEPSPTSIGSASPLSGSTIAPSPPLTQTSNRPSFVPAGVPSPQPVINQTQIAASIAEVGRYLRALEHRSTSIRRNIPIAFPHWYDVPRPDAIYVRNERTLGPAAPLGNFFPLNTQIDNTVPEDAVSNPSPTDPELPEMSSLTPHIDPPPPAPTGPPPTAIHFESCEQRNEWVAGQFRSFTTVITTELLGLEIALRGLRALRDLGGEHAGMGRRLPSSGDEVLELREALQDALARLSEEMRRLQGEAVADVRMSQECALMESDDLQDISTQSLPRSVAREPRERDLSASCRDESEEAKVERDARSDGVVYPDLPELAANESTRSQGSRSTECLQTLPYNGPSLAELAADESTRPRPTPILEMPPDEDTQPHLATPRDIRPASALPAPRLPEVVIDEHMRELSSVPPRVVPPTRYGLHDRPAHTRSYTCALGWIDGDDPETRPWDWNSHAHRYAANSNIGGEAETMASALLEIPRPTTRRGPGLPEPAADDAIRTLPADVFAPSTPTTRRVHGVPVEAYPIHEPGYPNVIDRETGFTHQESSPRYTEDQDLEITVAPAAPDPRRQLLERLRTSDLSYEQRRRSFAPSPAPHSIEEDPSPLTTFRQRSSTTILPMSPQYTQPSTVSGVVRRGSSPQATGTSVGTGIAASESLRSQLLAPTAERAAFSFGVDLTSLRSPERVRDENQPPVSPTSRDPHSRSSIAGILATGEGISAGGGPAQYSDLAHLHRTQGPAIGSSPVERLGSQDIYSNASVQRDSLRGSAGETMTRTGPMMGKNGKDEEERKIGEKQADEAGTVGH
ncbi:hypothetical protein LTR35_016419 [Friedmanniomyces endolithicus]|nr:hypothetical protein LTR35_016419 [Friedmanniomyces endolithicus]KAK0273123.1 hypothetical protein LTS00_015951 [Friedmanniomyces endolithicus]KAK0977286.1 hypothetical protein LTR54_016237 [Friedmanniomyces endolithicus]